LIGATFLGFVGMGTVLPALAPHVRNDLGGSDHRIGFVIGIFSVVALFARLFPGRWRTGAGGRSRFLAASEAARLPG
jgi:hypothetical protein